MAEAIIKYSDLINDDGGFLKLEKDFEKLGKTLTEQAKSWQSSLSVVSVQDTQSIQKYEKEIEKLKKSYSTLQTQKEKLEQVKKKSKQLSKEELIQLEKERIAVNKNKAEAKAIAQIKSSQAGSIEQLRARLALVTIAWAKLSEEERQNSEKGQRLVESKRQITQELKKEELATGDARRNVGNYKESVKEAIAEMNREREALIQKRKALRDDQNSVRESSAEYRVYQKEIDKTEKEINNLNNELREGVSANDNLAKSTDKSTQFLKRMVVAVGGFQLVRSGVQLISEFETQIADLSAVTGQTGSDLEYLKQQSIDFSKKFGVSASSIAEAFKLAGSARPELLKNGKAMADLTEKAIILSKASGDDVPTSIANLTGTLNAFDLPASKAGEIMDILANASQLGAQEIPYLTDAFGKFGGVASQAGVGISESAAAIEILGRKIKDPSTAGTNFRNILIKMQVEASKQGRTFQGLGKELEMLKPKMKDVTHLTKIYGDESLLAIQYLIQQEDELKNLQKEYGKTGTAQQQMDVKSKTLAESFNRLRETFKSYFLDVTNSSGVMEKFTGAIEFLGKNFNLIISLLTRVVVAFVAYKVVIGGISLIKTIKETIDYRKSVKALGEAQAEGTDRAKKFSTSMKAVGSALKSIGFAIAIELALELAKALYDTASGAKLAREQQELWDKANAQAEKNVGKVTSKLQEDLSEKKRLLDLEIRERKANGESSKKLDAEQFKREKNLEENALKSINKKIEYRKKEWVQAEDDLVQLQKLQEEINSKGKFANVSSSQQQIMDRLGIKALYQVEAGITKLTSKSTRLTKEIVDLSSAKKDFSDSLDELKIKIIEDTTATVNNTKSKKENNTEFKKSNDLLDARNKLLESEKQLQLDLQSIENEKKQAKVSNDIEAELKLREEQAREFGNADLSNLNSLINQEAELKKIASANELQFKIDALETEFETEKFLRAESKKEEYQELLKQKDLTTNERLKIESNYQLELEKLKQIELSNEKTLEIKKNNLKLEYSVIYDKIEEDKVEKQVQVNEQILDNQKTFIETLKGLEQAQVEESLIRLEQSLIDQNKIIEEAEGRQVNLELISLKNLLAQKYELRKRAIEDEYDFQLSQLKEGSIEYEKVEQEKINALINLENEYANEVNAINKKIDDNNKYRWSQFVDVAKNALSKILDRIEENAQKEVKISQDKITAQEKQVEIQRQRAEKGLTNSLAFEEKELAKAEARKLKAEKKLERAQMVKALYASYTANASSGQGNAISKTLRDFAILKAVELSFGDGGAVEDRLPGNGIFQGQSHKGNNGGIPIKVEGNEGIFSGREMRNMGKENFYKLKELAGRGMIGAGFFNKQTQMFVQAVPMQDNGLVREFQELKKAYQETQKSKFDIVQYTKDVFKIVETTTVKNMTNRTTHFVKRPKF